MNKETIKKDILHEFNNLNFNKAIDLAKNITNDELINFKLKILCFSSYKINQFENAIRYGQQLIRLIKYNDNEIIDTLAHSYLNINNYEKCIEFSKLSLKNNPDNYLNLNLIGISYSEIGDFDKGIKYFKNYLKKNPNDLSVSYNLALNFYKQKNYHESEKIFYRIVLRDENYRDSYLVYAIIKSELGKFKEAILLLEKLIKQNSSNSVYTYNLGVVYQKIQKFDLAINYFNRTIELDNSKPEHYNSIGVCYQKIFEKNKAEKAFRKALEIDKENKKTYNNLALLYQKSGLYKEALKFMDIALAKDPNDTETLFNKSILLLENGNYKTGFDLYKWRQKGRYANNLLFNLNDISRKKILFKCDQGLGDTFLAMRFLTLLPNYGAEISLLITKSMEDLLKHLDHRIKILTQKTSEDQYDHVCALGDLFSIFNISGSNIPLTKTYINIDEKWILKWKNKINKKKLNVGIVWQGNKNSEADEGRSFNLNYFKNISKIDDIELVSLQKNDGIEQLNNFKLSNKITDFSDELDLKAKFMDTAGLMKNLDLVISSDTSIVHLGGALGVKVWVVVQKYPYWYWRGETSDSIWYDSVKIYRQKIKNKWEEPFNKINNDLKKLRNIKLSKN